MESSHSLEDKGLEDLIFKCGNIFYAKQVNRLFTPSFHQCLRGVTSFWVTDDNSIYCFCRSCLLDGTLALPAGREMTDANEVRRLLCIMQIING